MIALTAALSVLVPQATDADHPLTKDRTGIRWVLPFTAARAKAERDARLLLIKPVAFGTSKSGGW